MFMSSKPPPPGSGTGLSEREEDRLYFRRVLEELVDIGIDLARVLLTEAKIQADPAKPGAKTPKRNAAPQEDITVSLERIARSIRATRKLADSLQVPIGQFATQVARPRLAAPPKAPPDDIADADNVIPFRRK
jgi:hypothetical protein